jgi:hypothetical protein
VQARGQVAVAQNQVRVRVSPPVRAAWAQVPVRLLGQAQVEARRQAFPVA